jgi:hypothetical protein
MSSCGLPSGDALADQIAWLNQAAGWHPNIACHMIFFPRQSGAGTNPGED